MQQKHIKTSEENHMSLKMIGENLTYLMRLHGVDANRLSIETGIGIATINNLRKGVGNPTISTLTSIGDYFNVKVGDLTDNDLRVTGEVSQNVKSIPLITYSDIERYLANKIRSTGTYTTEVDDIEDDSLFAVEITNNSLSPELDRGTYCIISLKEQYCDGDIVLVKLKNYPICLRRVFVSDENLQFTNISLESDNVAKSYSDYTIVGVLLKTVKRMK
ncbi:MULTISPECIES: helix-turn-helix domain-containing protein [Serratia]|uniref:helix-turn-helix domain-containing protein n=1 Tax=Serratia TaxID=613 RepID=UPI00125D016F|nr:MULTISPECIES: helix-turn-helix domain-containing protein [Serratia]KAB5500662.1 helix-turn-helix domain-containing protein [Enterobacter sp. RJAL6]MBH3283759.1 helix-turn-helix domain-containing protein [Serratia marcescens]MDR8481416.1 helix-turn-helix domain-containing protein [Serratia nevei]